MINITRKKSIITCFIAPHFRQEVFCLVTQLLFYLLCLLSNAFFYFLILNLNTIIQKRIYWKQKTEPFTWQVVGGLQNARIFIQNKPLMRFTNPLKRFIRNVPIIIIIDEDAAQAIIRCHSLRCIKSNN